MYDRLSITFDHTLGESFYHPMLSQVVEDLQKDGFLFYYIVPLTEVIYKHLFNAGWAEVTDRRKSIMPVADMPSAAPAVTKTSAFNPKL